jgi:hypothetical protein
MPVLADRNFYSYQAWQKASATGAALLWRVSGKLLLPAIHACPMAPTVHWRSARGSAAAAAKCSSPPRPPVPTSTPAILIRVIEYPIEDRPGSGELFCHITTIADLQGSKPGRDR